MRKEGAKKDAASRRARESDVAAFALNLTSGALTKDGVAVANLRDTRIDIFINHKPGVNDPPGLGVGFQLTARVFSPFADSIVLAQGPPGLIPPAPGAALVAAEYTLRSKVGDTLALSGNPANFVANRDSASVDGFQP